MEYKRLYKSSTDKAIFGVCGGIAEYLGIDSLIIRLVLVLFTLAFGAGLLFYIIAALLMPKRPEDGGMPIQPEQPGSYNATGTTYVNRASYAEPMAQEVTRSAVPQEAPAEPVPEPVEPADPVSAAWAKERETQETRGAAAGAPKTEAPKEEPAPKDRSRQGIPQEPKPEQPQAKRSYETYEAYQQPRQNAQQYSGKTTGSGDHSRTVLGIILMLIGVFVLIRVFLPYFDIRILFAICVIVAGGLLIAKKN